MIRKVVVSLSLWLAVSFSVWSQKTSTKPISLHTFSLKGTSIRAIVALNDSVVVYAGSKGDVGTITASGGVFVEHVTKDSIIPHFRALAVVNNSYYALSIGNPALLFKIEKAKKPLLVYTESHKDVFYDAIRFFDENDGIAMGDAVDGCLSMLLTRDGGRSWFKVACEDFPKTFEGEAAFAASNTNIAIVGDNVWIATGGKKARVFHSSDRGKSWRVYNTPIVQGKNTTGIYSIAFYDAKNGIVCGGDYTDKFGNYGNKAITTDGGVTWSLVAEGVSPKYVSCVQYVPKTNGKELIAVSTNGIFYSKDAGLSWEKLSNEGFYAVQIVDKHNAWLSGHEKIAKMSM